MNALAPADKLLVYLVEDNTDLRDELIFGLTTLGLSVSGFADAPALYRAMSVHPCNIVVIDVGLPGEDGFAVATHLRRNPALGLVFLTARTALQDRLHGLGLGADSYLIKPIDVRELAATLIALGRRLHPEARVSHTALTSIAPPHKGKHWQLSTGGRVLHNPNGVALSLSETERCFFQAMMPAAHQVVARGTLIAALAQEDDNYDPHRLDALISRLRKRCEQAGLGSLPLQSIRGVGYLFNA